jgi:hypothetical protein
VRKLEKRLPIHGVDKIPIGYGVTFFDYVRDEYVLYPVPFNLVLRWFRILWLRLAKPELTRPERTYLIGYERGLGDRSEAIIRARKAGWEDAFKFLDKELDKDRKTREERSKLS